MKILFIGWGTNGFKCLKSLIQYKFTPKCVIVPEGYDVRGMQKICKQHSIPVVDFQSSDYLMSKIRTIKPDLMIIASFPKILPGEIIHYPKFGSINVHTGELPKYRGYHPLNWAIIRDEKQVGVTIHYVEEKVDSGDILAQKTIPLKNEDDINTIKEVLTQLGAELLVQVVKKISKLKKKIKGMKQREDLATYAPKRTAIDGKIDWKNNTRDIFNLIRALKSPYPNAFAYDSNGNKIEFEESFLSNNCGKVLSRIKDHYLISTGDNVILVKVKQQLKIGEILR
ncbi:methionyl-tRNA formyltransferase [Candidatus Roizmanbacteria bacterium]|nr:methionyl-tRNA formyltransferase [Candidatus Roizmanbacteria bacterium]